MGALKYFFNMVFGRNNGCGPDHDGTITPALPVDPTVERKAKMARIQLGQASDRTNKAIDRWERMDPIERELLGRSK